MIHPRILGCPSPDVNVVRVVMMHSNLQPHDITWESQGMRGGGEILSFTPMRASMWVWFPSSQPVWLSLAPEGALCHPQLHDELAKKWLGEPMFPLHQQH
jgi:hypothetical protein